MKDVTNLKYSLNSIHKTHIDEVIHKESGITIVAARPGMGRSILMMTIAMRWAEQGRSVLYLSEYRGYTRQQSLALLSNHLHPLNKEKETYNSSIHEWQDSYTSYLENYFDKNTLTMIHDTEFTDNCIDTILKHVESNRKPDIIMIDGFTNIRKDCLDNYTDESYHDLIIKFNYLQRALQIPVVLTGDVSNEVDKREHKEPEPMDLVNSHIFLRYCESIVGLYRPNYYGLTNENQFHANFPDTLLFYSTDNYGIGKQHIKIDYNTMKVHFE